VPLVLSLGGSGIDRAVTIGSPGAAQTEVVFSGWSGAASHGLPNFENLF